MAHYPGGPGNGRVKLPGVPGKAGHIDIAYTLARQGEGLGVRIADDGVFIYAGDEGHFHSVIDQFPIGLIGDDVYGMAVLCSLTLQQSGQGLQTLPGVYNAGGVVGGVYYDGLGAGAEKGFKLVQGYLRLSYCVAKDMIERSLPAFKALLD